MQAIRNVALAALVACVGFGSAAVAAPVPVGAPAIEGPGTIETVQYGYGYRQYRYDQHVRREIARDHRWQAHVRREESHLRRRDAHLRRRAYLNGY